MFSLYCRESHRALVAVVSNPILVFSFVPNQVVGLWLRQGPSQTIQEMFVGE